MSNDVLKDSKSEVTVKIADFVAGIFHRNNELIEQYKENYLEISNKILEEYFDVIFRK
jgi:hypothetical protein